MLPDNRICHQLMFSRDKSSQNGVFKHKDVELVWSNTSAHLHFPQDKQKRKSKASVPPKINISSVYMGSVKLLGLISTLDWGNCLFRAAEIPEKQIKLPCSISTISLLWSKAVNCILIIYSSQNEQFHLPEEGPELALNGWERKN